MSSNDKLNSSGHASLLAVSGRAEASSVLSKQPDVIDGILQSTVGRKDTGLLLELKTIIPKCK